jgi:hypothetical protein
VIKKGVEKNQEKLVSIEIKNKNLPEYSHA